VGRLQHDFRPDQYFVAVRWPIRILARSGGVLRRPSAPVDATLDDFAFASDEATVDAASEVTQ
jgi:hypothetical protein